LSKNAGCIDGPSITENSSATMLCGDFDIAVDYRFVTFPAAAVGSGRFQSMVVRDATSGNLLAGVERYRETVNSCVPTVDAYKLYTTVPGCVTDASYIPTTDTQGRFRLVRTGTTVRGYYWNGGAWVEGMNRTIPTVPVVVVLYTGTNGTLTTAHQVAFDNFQCNGHLVAVNDRDPDGLTLSIQGNPMIRAARMSIAFRLPAAGRTALRIYDSRGRLVTELSDEVLAAGVHAASWDGRAGDGARVPGGIYLIALSAESGMQVRKLVIVP
jgi:hypothetical protein